MLTMTSMHYEKLTHDQVNEGSSNQQGFEVCIFIYLRGARTKKSTFLKNSHPRTGPMSFAAKGKKKKKKKSQESSIRTSSLQKINYLQKNVLPPLKQIRAFLRSMMSLLLYLLIHALCSILFLGYLKNLMSLQSFFFFLSLLHP